MNKTTAQAFRTAVASGARSDLYDVTALVARADATRRALAELDEHPERHPAGVAAVRAATIRRAFVSDMTREARAMVERTHSVALAERDAVRGACQEPERAFSFQARHDAEVNRYVETLLDMSDEALVAHANERQERITAPVYDEIRALVNDLMRRRLNSPAQEIEDALYAAKGAYRTSPRYTTAVDKLARAETWLQTNPVDSDPELRITADEREYTARVSELLEPVGEGE